MLLKVIQIAGFSVTLTVGLPGNLLVLITVWLRKSLHTMLFLILASLALSYLLFLGIVVISRTISVGYSRWVFSIQWCSFSDTFVCFSYLSNVLHLCVANIECNRAIIKPLTYDQSITKSKIVSLLWVIPIVSSLLLRFTAFVSPVYSPSTFGCEIPLSSEGTKRYVLFTVYLALFFGVPFAVIAVIQKKIYSVAKHHATEIQAQQNATVLGRAKEKNKKAAEEVALVTFAFVFFFPASLASYSMPRTASLLGVPRWVSAAGRLVPIQRNGLQPHHLLVAQGNILWATKVVHAQTESCATASSIYQSVRKQTFYGQSKMQFTRWNSAHWNFFTKVTEHRLKVWVPLL